MMQSIGNKINRLYIFIKSLFKGTPLHVKEIFKLYNQMLNFNFLLISLILFLIVTEVTPAAFAISP